MNQVSEKELQVRFEKIVAREQLLASVEELANVGTWTEYLINGEVEWSDQMYRICGYEPGSVQPSMKTFLSHVYAEDVESVTDTINLLRVSKVKKKLDFRIIDNNNVLKYISAVHVATLDNEGHFINLTGIARDITGTRMLEVQLKDSQAYYQASISNSMSAFFVSNDKGEILETNEVACKMFGYTSDELKSLSRHQVLQDHDSRFINSMLNRKSSGRIRGEIGGFKKSGEFILVEFTSTQFLDANNLERVILSMVDITSRKLQEETLLQSNERFEHVSKATFDAIWDWDIKSKRLYFGDRFLELFGYHVENNTGDFSTWHTHIHPEDKERVILSRLNKIINQTESNWKDEYRYLRADGTVAYIADRGILLRNSTGTYRMIGVMQDVTELKENETAIRDLNRALEKRAHELIVSNEELERFAYVASHDLQEPLRMVSSFLQLLQSKYTAQLDESAHKYINYAVDGADRMKTLILDLLDYSRISSDKDNYRMINLNELIGKTLRVLQPVVDESEASIIVSNLPDVYGNSSQLIRLFQNLISNALKYRSAIKPVIEIGFSETNDEWQFFIKDNGIGIDAKYFEKIFIIFKRLHSRTDYSGTGIGLAICKKIIDLHRGKIWVESTLKAGSQFHFTLSKARLPAKTAALPSSNYPKNTTVG